jgi:DNA-binding transcriptional LysR family regulator
MRDLNDLHFFAAVVANGGFSAAARALGAPKSRVSRRVAALEERLGVRLVERSTRRIRVTEVGQDVYRHARAALAEADAIDEVVSRQKAEPQGLVRVSCPFGIDRLLGDFLPQFLTQHPRLRVQLVVTNRPVDLIEEGIDVAIRVREKLDSDADLQVKIILRSGGMLVASPALLAEHGHPAEPADLARFPTLGRADRLGLERWTLSGGAGEATEILHEPRLSASDFPILRSAAVAGVGIALLPEWVSREPLASGQLVRVLPDWESREGIVHLVFTSKRGLLPGVRAVIDFLAQALRADSPVWQASD